jgi:hypothetical protein
MVCLGQGDQLHPHLAVAVGQGRVRSVGTKLNPESRREAIKNEVSGGHGWGGRRLTNVVDVANPPGLLGSVGDTLGSTAQMLEEQL